MGYVTEANKHQLSGPSNLDLAKYHGQQSRPSLGAFQSVMGVALNHIRIYMILYGIFPWKKPSIMGIIIYFNRIFHYKHPIEPSILGIVFGKLHLGHEWFLCPHSKLSDVRRDRNPHAVPQGARFEVPHTLAVVNPGVDGHKIEAIPCKHWIIYLSSRG